MKNEKIVNATLTTINDVIALCNDLNQDSTFDAIPEKLTNKVNELNENIILAHAKSFLTENAQDFYKSIVCVQASNPFDAISVEIAKLSLTDSGNLQVDIISKSLVFDDFYKAKLSTLAFAHADKKPTKDDRQKAHKYFYGVNGEGLMQCLIYTATDSQKFDGMNLKKSADLIKAYTTIKTEYEKQGKDNPFDGVSNRKKVEQITRVITEFIGNFTEWQLTKYHFDAFAQLVASLNRKGVFVINNLSTTMQALVLVCRYAFNKVPFEIKDKAKILHKN